MPHVHVHLTRKELQTLQSGGRIHINWKKVGKVFKKGLQKTGEILKPVAKELIKDLAPVATVGLTGAMTSVGIPAPVSAIASNAVVNGGKQSLTKMIGGGLWIDHVKKTQKEHGCSYKEAMQKAKLTYNKSGKGIWLA